MIGQSVGQVPGGYLAALVLLAIFCSNNLHSWSADERKVVKVAALVAATTTTTRQAANHLDSASINQIDVGADELDDDAVVEEDDNNNNRDEGEAEGSVNEQHQSAKTSTRPTMPLTQLTSAAKTPNSNQHPKGAFGRLRVAKQTASFYNGLQRQQQQQPLQSVAGETAAEGE